jgi:hypothetical protein
MTAIVVTLAILVLVMVVDHTDHLVQVIFVHVARRDDLAIRMAQKVICIVGPLAAATDDAHDDLLRRRFAGRGATSN